MISCQSLSLSLSLVLSLCHYRERFIQFSIKDDSFQRFSLNLLLHLLAPVVQHHNDREKFCTYNTELDKSFAYFVELDKMRTNYLYTRKTTTRTILRENSLKQKRLENENDLRSGRETI